MQHSHEALDREGGFSRANLLTPLRRRDFRVLWAGMTISLIGDGAFLVAMTWQVYAISNAPKALAMAGIAMTVPTILLLLFGGVVTDRFDRRRVLIMADVIRGVAVAVMAVLSLTGALELWHVMVLVAFYGAGQAFFGPAFDAIVPNLLPESELAQANSLDQLVRPIAFRLVGPALGGWMIAGLGVGTAFALDAVSFVASVAAVLAMRAPGDRRRGGLVVGDPRHPPGAGLRAGERVAVGHPGVGRDRLPGVPRADRGAAPVRGQERPRRRRRPARHGVRCRRPGIGDRRVRDGRRRLPAPQHHRDLRDLDAGDARGLRLRAGHRVVAADGRQLRLQRAGDGRHDRLGDDEAAARPGIAPRTRVQPRLADLDRPAARLLRPDRADRRADRRPGHPGRRRVGRHRRDGVPRCCSPACATSSGRPRGVDRDADCSPSRCSGVTRSPTDVVRSIRMGVMSRTSLVAACAAALLALVPAAQADPFFPNAGNLGYDVAPYDLHLQYEPATRDADRAGEITAPPESSCRCSTSTYAG